jgi:hypothetical protein
VWHYFCPRPEGQEVSQISLREGAEGSKHTEAVKARKGTKEPNQIHCLQSDPFGVRRRDVMDIGREGGSRS